MCDVPAFVLVVLVSTAVAENMFMLVDRVTPNTVGKIALNASAIKGSM